MRHGFHRPSGARNDLPGQPLRVCPRRLRGRRNGDWLRESSSGACPPSDARRRSALETGTGSVAKRRGQSPFPGRSGRPLRVVGTFHRSVDRSCVALSGRSGSVWQPVPRALPWAFLFRPVGATRGYKSGPRGLSSKFWPLVGSLFFSRMQATLVGTFHGQPLAKMTAVFADRLLATENLSRNNGPTEG